MRPRRLDKVFSYPESPDLHKYRVAHMMRRVNLPCLLEGKGAIVKHPAQNRHTLRYSPKDPDRPHPYLKKRAASAAPSIIDRLRQSVFLRNGDFQSVEILAEVDLARQERIFVAMVRAVRSEERRVGK